MGGTKDVRGYLGGRGCKWPNPCRNSAYDLYRPRGLRGNDYLPPSHWGQWGRNRKPPPYHPYHPPPYSRARNGLLDRPGGNDYLPPSHWGQWGRNRKPPPYSPFPWHWTS